MDKAISELDKILVCDQKACLLGLYNKKITQEEKYTLNKSKVVNFNDSISNYSVDSSGYRLHTPLVRLPKYLRKYVTYNGQHLVSLDLKNSQPFLLCTLLGKKLWDMSQVTCVQKLYPEYYDLLIEQTSEQKKKTIYWKVFNSIQKMELERAIQGSSVIPISIMLSKSMETPINNGDKSLNIKKLDNFKKVCEAGELYETLGDIFKGKFKVDDIDPYGTRDAVKLQTMLIFYGNYKKGILKFTKLKSLKAFIEVFPEIGNFLLILKSVGHKYCPCLLQRLESHLILKEVATEIYRRKIPTPVFTVHDSIVVLPEFADEVQQIMSDTIFIKTGLRPKIKPEKWE